jgi:ATP-binding cassette subfamily F protein uup
MDKLCTKLLVFEGEGRIKEWVGSYTELRETQKAAAAKATSGKRKAAEPGSGERTAAPATSTAARKKLTYAERLELQRIDKELPRLEERKAELLSIMSAGGTDHHALMERSIELERTVHELDRLTDRWLELSEREG